MKIILAAVTTVALLAAPCYAQGMGGKRGHRAPQQNTEQQKIEEQKKKAAEKAFRAASDRIPDHKEKFDPWKNVR